MTPRTQGIVGILLGVGASVAAVTTSVAFGESNDDEENELLENHVSSQKFLFVPRVVVSTNPNFLSSSQHKLLLLSTSLNLIMHTYN